MMEADIELIIAIVSLVIITFVALLGFIRSQAVDREVLASAIKTLEKLVDKTPTKLDDELLKLLKGLSTDDKKEAQ